MGVGFSLLAEAGARAGTEVRAGRKPPLPMRLVLLVLLAAAAVLPFLDTLRYDFVWDDHYIVAHVEELSRTNGLSAVLSAPFFPHPGIPDTYYRPVVYLSYWIDHRLGLGSPWMFHLTNLLLNLACVLFCAVLFRRLIPDDTAAFIGSLLFALHPTHVESVAFISGRTDLLATMFLILAVLAWINLFAADRPPSMRAAWLVWGTLAFFLGLLSKENAVVLPIVLVSWERWAATSRPSPDTGWWRRNGPWLGLHSLALAVCFVLRFVVLRQVSTPSDPLEDTVPLLLDQTGFAALGLLRMIRMLVVPWPHNALYTRQHLTLDILSVLAAGAACAILIGSMNRRFDRVGRVGGVWVAGFLAPVLLVPSIGIVVIAERYLYLPSMGFCLAVCCLLSRIPRSRFHRIAIVVGVTLGALALGGTDFARARIWRDDVALGTDLVRTSPDSALAHARLGQGLLAAGRYWEAFESLQEAASRDPLNPGGHNDLGIALRHLNQPAVAAETFRQALRLDPAAVETRLNLAYACITLRDRACVEEQRQALSVLDPEALAKLDQELKKHLR